jgi:hypothetical protein
MRSTLGQPFDATRIPISKLEQMRRDPMIAFGLMFIKVFLARAPWYIKSTDARRAAFIDGALRDIYARFILQYSNSFDYGYSAMVKRFERKQPEWEYYDPSDPNGMPIKTWNSSADALVWKPFQALPPRFVYPAFNKAGEFNGFYIKPWGFGANQFPFETGSQPDVPLDWALWATNEKDSVFGSLWGYPRTGYSYRYWWAYWYRFGLADRAFEKWADPPVVAYHPAEIVFDQETGQKVNFNAEALALAEKLRSGANVSLPSTVVLGLDERVTNVREWQLEQIETTANFDALGQSFEYLDVAKLRSLMVPEQAFLEGRGGTSSRNVASTLGDVFEEQQALVKQEIDDHLNRFVIPQLLEANFGPGGPSCRIVTTGFDAKDMETMRSIVQAFAQNAPGRLSSINFRELLDRLGIPLVNADAAAKQAEEIIQETVARGPQAQPAQGGPGGQAGVRPGASGKNLYYDARERIELEDAEEFVEEISTGVYDRITTWFSERWESLRGEKGEPGKPGEPGEKGDPGEDGKITFAVEQPE